MKTSRIVLLVCIHAVLTLITNFPSGFTNSTVNTAVEQLHSYINGSYVSRGYTLSGGEILWIQSGILNVWFISQVFGAMVAPFFTDKYGRKRGYLIGASFTLCSSIVQMLSIRLKLPEMLTLGRGMTAFASPLMDACLIMYVQETAPLEMRGALSFFAEIGYGAMCVLGSILGMPSVLGSSLETLLMVSIVPEIFSIIFLFCIPETPKYLMIIKNDREASRSSLVFFQGQKKDHDLLLNHFVKERDEDQSKDRSSFKEVFTRWQLRQAVLLGSCVLVLTLSFYPILQSSTYFFLKSGIRRDLAQKSSTILLTVFTISSIFGSFLIDRYPRRLLIIFFGLISNTFLLMFSLFSTFSHDADWVKYASMGSIMLYIISFGLVLGPISWFVAPELVSQRHRSTVFSVCYSIGNVLITCTNFSVIPLFKVIGGLTFIPLFIVPSLCCILYLYFCLPETLGKETHEIVADMTRKRNRVPDLESPIRPVRF